MYKLIIADDEEMIRHGMAKYIPWNDIGFQVEAVCKDGKQVLQAIEQYDVDVIMTDIKMPYYDGLDIIRMVYEKGKHIYFVIISAYNDFEYAQKAMEYGVKHFIKKPVKMDKLCEVFTKVKQELDEKEKKDAHLVHMNDMVIHTLTDARKWVINSLLQGSKPETKQMEEYGLQFLGKKYRVGIINVDDYHDDTKVLKNIIKDKLGQNKDYCYYVVESALVGFVILFNYNEYDVEKVLQEVKEYIVAFFSGPVKISISPEYDDIYHTSKYFIIAVNDLYNKNSGKKKTRQSNTSEYPYLFENKVLYSIAHNRGSDLKEKFDCFLNQFSKEELVNQKEYCIQFMMNVKTWLRKKNYNLDYILEKKTNIAEIIVKSERIYDVEAYIYYILVKINDYLMDNAKHEDNIALRIKEYIFNHCDKNISLEMLAEHFHMNPIYLSSFFKKNNGMNYSSYLTKCRMDLAKQLLEDTELNINEVSSRTGYPNSKHFSMVFRKITGLTPSQYRRLNKK